MADRSGELDLGRRQDVGTPRGDIDPRVAAATDPERRDERIAANAAEIGRIHGHRLSPKDVERRAVEVDDLVSGVARNLVALRDERSGASREEEV